MKVLFLPIPPLTTGAWPDPKSLRNLLVPEYRRVDLDIVLATSEPDSPALESATEMILADHT